MQYQTSGLVRRVRRAAVAGGLSLAVTLTCAGTAVAAPPSGRPGAPVTGLSVLGIPNPLGPLQPGYFAPTPEQRVRDYEDAGMFVGGMSGVFVGMLGAGLAGMVIGGGVGVPVGWANPALGIGAVGGGMAIGAVAGEVIGAVGGAAAGAAIGRQVGGDIARAELAGSPVRVGSSG